MNFLDRTDHSRLADQANARIRAAAIADKYIPAVDRQVAPADNNPPQPLGDVIETELQAVIALSDADAVKAYAEAAMAKTPAIAAANDQMPLLKAFLADNPVIGTAEEAQKAAAWIEGTRKTLGAMEDERKPRVEPLNAALGIINEAYRTVRQPLETMLNLLRKRWNTWDAAERERRETEARRVREAAEDAARQAQALIDQAKEALEAAEQGSCEDVSVVVDAEAAMATANKLDRLAGRAERATNVRVASTLGGKALGSRRQRVIVIDDPVAAIKAIGPTDKIILAIQQCAKTFEEIHGELPVGTHEEFARSI
jgi:hypothetical protein